MIKFYLSDMDGKLFQGTSSDPIRNFHAINHDCPLCGQKASRGRSLVWIASECIQHGKAVFPCQSCGELLNTPSAIFVKGSLESLNQRPYAMIEVMREMSQQELLVQNWGQVLFAENKGGPIDSESLEWDGIGTCPGCGYEYAQELSQKLECMWCQTDFWVNQQDISRTGNTNVLCSSCKRSMVIPPTVWCPTCGRNIRSIFVKLFKEANQVGCQPQGEKLSISKSETLSDSIKTHSKWWQFRKK